MDLLRYLHRDTDLDMNVMVTKAVAVLSGDTFTSQPDPAMGGRTSRHLNIKGRLFNWQHYLYFTNVMEVGWTKNKWFSMVKINFPRVFVLCTSCKGENPEVGFLLKITFLPLVKIPCCFQTWKKPFNNFISAEIMFNTDVFYNWFTTTKPNNCKMQTTLEW